MTRGNGTALYCSVAHRKELYSLFGYVRFDLAEIRLALEQDVLLKAGTGRFLEVVVPRTDRCI